MKLLLIVWISLAAITACTGKEDLVVWRAKETSPDKQWQASADTVQNGGFGSASVDTAVYLKRTSDQKSPQEVLVFHCRGPVPHPYVLDNVANSGGTIDLHMTWVSPIHLHVTYSGHPDIEFQVVKYGEVAITAQDLSDAAPSSQPLAN